MFRLAAGVGVVTRVGKEGTLDVPFASAEDVTRSPALKSAVASEGENVEAGIAHELPMRRRTMMNFSTQIKLVRV